ncbi:NAD(P)/FAD-dependent oxidoreductase [Balneola vulgaris]|uniref:NAD(P)/FAD-dependent oxidoreductase n=1 Tax=Balneola vulgaris TaxID=287535 RepID=UPI0003707AB0|nr:FAD-dependent oxidoreductase [Balneola vulgaris]
MTVDYCILGAGLAGLSLAKNLSDLSQKSILILDPNDVAAGASGTPMGLINPATGRFAHKTWRAEEAVDLAVKNLEVAQSFSETSFFKKTGVIRPAMDQKIARRMQENFVKDGWPDNWCSWLNEAEIKDQFPDLSCTEGAVYVHEAYTVCIPDYLMSLKDYLTHRNLQFKLGTDYTLSVPTSKEGTWTITCSDGSEIKASCVIVTAGIESTSLDVWNELPLHPVKGQVAELKCTSPFPYQSAVSALGYFASLDTNSMVAGSTYEHNFDHTETDEQGLAYILGRMKRVMPEYMDQIVLEKQWAGVRASTPDRMPIVGAHPKYRNLFVLTGLGSKGLLYSGLLGYDLARHIVSGAPLSEEVSVTRFLE